MKKRTNLARSAAVIFSMTLISSACYAVTCSALGTAGNTQIIDSSCNGSNKYWTSGNLDITSTGTLIESAGGHGLVVNSNVTVGDLTNAGQILTITSNRSGIATGAGSSISSIVNAATGVIGDTSGRFGISGTGTIQSITNFGAIAGAFYGIQNATISTTATIGTLTNVGTITGSYYSIYNNQGVITTINNLQGSTSSALSMNPVGSAPLNYNVIINSTSSYGQIALPNSGGVLNVPQGSSMAFNIYGNTGTTLVSGVNAATVSAFRYLNVLTGISSLTSITGTTGTYSGYNYSLVADATAANSWDLLLTSPVPAGPSAADTQDSLTQAASALRSVFNQQTAVVNNSLNYDCTVFAENGLCVSGGGRVATTNSITGERASTLLVAAYKALNNMRVGAYIDQNVPANNVTGISMDKSPMYGLFGVWNQRQDAMGYEVRLATGYSNQNITQTRNVVGTSEAGVGTASLTTQATSAVVSYAMPVTDSTWIASPYVGIRKTKVTRGGYTETSAVTAPLTYSDLNQDITTALAGVRTNKKLGDNFYVMGSVGIEQNVGSSISTLDATGVTGLTATDFSANYAKTRPVASVGASYAIAKDQRISLSAMYRKEAFHSSGSTTGMVMYQVGL